MDSKKSKIYLKEIKRTTCLSSLVTMPQNFLTLKTDRLRPHFIQIVLRTIKTKIRIVKKDPRPQLQKQA